ncbi:AAA domain-containing protein [Candidatus Poriferisocius sp.]|uniref:AAA domain-containing protein n=1 Tax=Candidatus Poriferisocius sp. TaxID=3101276 RepID=UPI003B01B72B
MNLIKSQTVVIAGRVKNRQVIHPISSNQPFVKATLLTEDGDRVAVVWWDSGRAPAEGVDLKLKGVVREYNGKLEVHANEWDVKETGPPNHPAARIIGFYMECVESEAASSVSLRLSHRSYIQLNNGSSPVLGPRNLPTDDHSRSWCQQRTMALGESIIAGWPLVIGVDMDKNIKDMVASPLLTVPVQLSQTGKTWRIQPDSNTVELNPYSLNLLGIDRQERDALAQLIEDTPAVEEAQSMEDRAYAIISTLQHNEVDGLANLNPQELTGQDGSEGIHNTGIIFASSRSMQFTRMLLEDLEELLNNPKLLEKGPAAVMLGLAPAPAVPFPKPHPTVLPSTMAQDQAVTSAMENIFSVVTGPPGTGKSQVLVNVVTAAIARQESVLFASKNNQAVDVVFERLAQTTKEPCMIRAGAAGYRSDVASNISKILSTPQKTIDPMIAHHKWTEIEGSVLSIHNILQHRLQLENEISYMKGTLYDRLNALPASMTIDIDIEKITRMLKRVETSLRVFSERLGFISRWKKHQKRLDKARNELQNLYNINIISRDSVEQLLKSVADKPKRSLIPVRDFYNIEKVVSENINTIRWARNTQAKIDHKYRELNSLPNKQQLDDQLYQISEKRTEAGRALLDTRWEQIRWDNPIARTASGELAELLRTVSKTGSGARRARNKVQESLPSLPVWGITNLSARTNLPLISGLFDLVIIDEASACDVASALPLLVRARRALIIGDRKQLIHTTSLSSTREDFIGRRWALTDDRINEFSYKSRSCFGLASTRVDESPIFLDLHFRSHPAIIGFSNNYFYDNRLELCSTSRPPQELPAIEWVRVDGDSRKGPGGRSRINPQEATVLASAVNANLPTLNGLGLSLGVVTPYRAQADLIIDHLSRTLSDEMRDKVTVATAHRFQGDERDVIYFSPVVGPSTTKPQATFAADPNLVNVALTRARRRLVIFGNMEACLRHNNILADLARYVSRLEAGSFDSPLELALHEALLDQGIVATTGMIVAGHRLDLAINQGSYRLDIECDGAAFHIDREADSIRDRAIKAEGWTIMRFSGRRLSTDLTGCVNEIISELLPE